VTERLTALPHVRKIASLTPSFGENPIYAIEYRGVSIAFYTSMPGAPACICGFEDVIAMGARHFVFFGSCGVLDRTIEKGHVLIPQSAIRDEGTSCHYAPASDEIALDPACVQAIIGCAESRGIPYTTVKTWSNDAFYRETPEKVRRRKEQGCKTVDMECSALAAVAKFRGVSVAEFFYAADNLDADRWDARDLRKHGASGAGIYVDLALDSALAIASQKEEP
jgi:uridine phosphorylase